jgi:hypothetical protein
MLNALILKRLHRNAGHGATASSNPDRPPFTLALHAIGVAGKIAVSSRQRVTAPDVAPLCGGLAEGPRGLSTAGDPAGRVSSVIAGSKNGARCVAGQAPTGLPHFPRQSSKRD